MTPDPDFKLTGGPRPQAQEAAARKLRDLLLLEDDVFRVVDLAPQPGHPGRWLYCIETPFPTYPRYAVGTTDDACSEVHILSLHSAEWAATQSFEKALQP